HANGPLRIRCGLRVRRRGGECKNAGEDPEKCCNPASIHVVSLTSRPGGAAATIIGFFGPPYPYDAQERRMTDVKIFGEHAERTKEQLARCMTVGSVVGGVLCADGHLGYAQPVGGVIAYEDHVSVSGVGFDIACGNMAVRLDLPKAAIADRIGPLVNEIAANVSFGLGRTNVDKVEHDLFDSPLWHEAEVVAPLKEM